MALGKPPAGWQICSAAMLPTWREMSAIFKPDTGQSLTIMSLLWQRVTVRRYMEYAFSW